MREAHKIIVAGAAGILLAFAAAALGIAIGRPANTPAVTQPDAQAAARAMTFTTAKTPTP